MIPDNEPLGILPANVPFFRITGNYNINPRVGKIIAQTEKFLIMDWLPLSNCLAR